MGEFDFMCVSHDFSGLPPLMKITNPYAHVLRRRGQKQPKMAYIAICLQGKTLMLFNKSQQQTIHGSTLSDWRQTLFGALKCGKEYT